MYEPPSLVRVPSSVFLLSRILLRRASGFWLVHSGEVFVRLVEIWA